MTAVLVPGMAYGATATPPPDSPGQQRHLTLDNGKTKDIYVMNGVDLSQPIQLGNADGTTVTVNITAVDGAPETAAGKAPSGATTDSVTPAAFSWYTWAAPADSLWHTSVNGQALAGSGDSFNAGYSVTIDSNSVGGACVQIKGHKKYTNVSGGTYYDAYWKSIGCWGAGSSFGGTVQWMNVLDYKQIKAKAVSPPAGSAGMFQ